MDQSTFSEESYRTMQEIFEKNNPELAADKEEMRKRLNELHSEIANLMQEKPETWQAAVKILLQGRNFFARYLGEAEMVVDFDEAKEDVAEIERKHVAVYVQGGGQRDIFRQALEKTLGLFKDTLRFQLYGEMSELITAILRGEICGVVALQFDRLASIESHIRHDLKNLSGWGQMKAGAFVLMPCVDFYLPHKLIEIANAIKEMQSGVFRASVRENFSLQERLSDLVPHMHVPKTGILVAVVDDEREKAESLSNILAAWPNVEVALHVQRDGQVPVFPQLTDILLLDEGLDGITGTRCYAALRQAGFQGLVASITSGHPPTFTPWHFGGKILIDKDFQFALDFVRFMNQLIAEVEKGK